MFPEQPPDWIDPTSASLIATVVKWLLGSLRLLCHPHPIQIPHSFCCLSHCPHGIQCPLPQFASIPMTPEQATTQFSKCQHCSFHAHVPLFGTCCCPRALSHGLLLTLSYYSHTLCLYLRNTPASISISVPTCISDTLSRQVLATHAVIPASIIGTTHVLGLGHALVCI